MSPANVAVHYFVWKEKNWGHCCWALEIGVSVIEEWRSCNKYTSKMQFRKELVCMKTIAIKHIYIVNNIPIINFVFFLYYKLLFEQWKPDPQCSKIALFQSNTTRHTLAYKNKKIRQAIPWTVFAQHKSIKFSLLCIWEQRLSQLEYSFRNICIILFLKINLFA